MNLLITGSISYDEIMDFPGKFVDYLHPEKLHQINVSFVVDRLEKQFGGTATNIVYNIVKVLDPDLRRDDREAWDDRRGGILRQAQNDTSGPKIKLLGAVGKDGEFFLKFFKKNKIDTEGILVDKKLYSAFGSVITDIKDNQIWGFYYGASVNGAKIDLKKYLDKNNLMIISANHPKAFLNFQSQAIKYKIPYIYDPGMAMTWIKDKDLKNGIMNCIYLVGNDYEIAVITKRLKVTVGELVDKRIKVITTLGEKGVRYEEKTINNKYLKLEIPAYKVKKVVDPTGAGDAWRGGFIAGLAKRWKLRESLKLGNVMASFAIEKYGTVNHKPTLKEIKKRFNNVL